MEQKQEFKQTPILIGISQEANRIRDFISKAATTEHTILLQGETGVGKDHIAELIHYTGKPNGAFVLVDCGTLPETLSETELFGHTQGAFTDAREVKQGLIRVAENGTLFINEVTNMSLTLQAKFLRVLEKKTFRPVGGVKEISINTRIIAATNVNLELAVQRGKLRLDLFHRLNNVVFTIAPLRDRRDDIPVLTEYFLQQEQVSKKFSPKTIKVLKKYLWPGNVRELKSVITEAVFYSGEEDIEPENIYPYLTGIGKNATSMDEGVIHVSENGKLPTLNELQKEYLRRVLTKTQGNILKATHITGLAEKTMHNKIDRFKLREFVLLLRVSKKN